MITVISPHMDDAVLSLGQHIINWIKQGLEVKVITVFTKFGNGTKIPEYSTNYLRKSGFTKIYDFEKARVKEDVEAMKKLHVKYEHWGFVDGGFRGMYPDEKMLLSGKVIEYDLVDEIRKKIKRIEGDILLPYGVGGHVDHIIVKKAGEIEGRKIKYYLESPYLWQKWQWIKYIKKIVMSKNKYLWGLNKTELLKCYKSQYKLLTAGNDFFGEVLVIK